MRAANTTSSHRVLKALYTYSNEFDTGGIRKYNTFPLIFQEISEFLLIMPVGRPIADVEYFGAIRNYIK